MSQSDSTFYVTGGTLRQDAACYVERKADKDLLDGLLKGEFCYVLTSRQMGKSSLMVRTAGKLREQGVRVAVLDLTAVGQPEAKEQWYFGLLTRLGVQTRLEDELEEFWLANPALGPVQRFFSAIHDVLLSKKLMEGELMVDGPKASVLSTINSPTINQLVIFVDELDVVRSLSFSTDEFFAAIRECYTRRTEDPEFNRLTFCLLGVATPSDLIRDTRITPFNIGRRIELHDFAPEEATPLAGGLNVQPSTFNVQLSTGAKASLDRILYWTNGHPYLTQRLCRAVAERATRAEEDSSDKSEVRAQRSEIDQSLLTSAATGLIDGLCAELFFSSRAREQDDNLLFVRERLLRSDADLAGLLTLYGHVLTRKRAPDDETNPLVSALRLSGVTRSRNACLEGRNRIYEQVFDRKWIHANMPDAEVRRQQAAYRRGLLRAASVAALVVLVISTLAVVATRARKAESRQREAAVKASASEAEQRKLADMQLAVQAWEEGDVRRANDLIDGSRPVAGQPPGFEWRYLRKFCQDESQETLGGPNHRYRSALFFGGDLLLLNDEKTLSLQGLSRRKNQLLLEDQDGIERPTFCSGNTNLLATVTDHGRIKVWDLAARRVRVEFEGHPRSSINSIAFSPDGRWLASASDDKSVKLWDVQSRNIKPVRIVHRYSYVARAVVFSPDGRQLFASGSETLIRSWDVATGTESPAPLEGQTGWGVALAISPDGLWLVSGCGDSTVIVWSLSSRKLERRLVGHIAGLGVVAFSPDGRILASGGGDHIIRLWDLKTGQQISLLCGHGTGVNWLSFSPDGQLLASRSDDGLVKLWQATTGLEGNALRGSPEWLQDVALSPDGRRAASVAINSFAVNLWDLPTRSVTLLTGHSNTVMCAAFSPDGRILATGSHDQTVRLWDVRDHKAVATLTNGFPVGSLAFSPDGRTLIVGGSSWYDLVVGERAGLQFWDVASRKATGTISGDASDIVELALSASGSLLATGHKDGAVSLWDAQTRRLLHRFGSQFRRQVISLACSATEPLLAASDMDGNIVLYNTTTMEVLQPPLKAHSNRVMSLAFSPDGRTLASAGEGGGLRLWNVATRQLALTLKGHVGAVTGVAFSLDGNFLASCGADATVRLWPAATVEEAGAATKMKTKKP